MRNQNELAKESSEVADFWNMLQGWQSIGKCVEKVHFNIRYLTKFRPMLTNMDIKFKEAHPILYLNMRGISSLFSSRNSTQNITAQPLVVVHHSLLSEIPSGISRIEAGPVPHHAVERHTGLHHRREGWQGVPAYQS